MKGYQSGAAVMGVILLLVAACGERTGNIHQSVQSKDTGEEPGNSEASDTVVTVDPATLPGRSLHDMNCVSCHDASMYTRPESKVRNFPALLARAQRCNAGLAPKLSDDEIEQVAVYLEQAYYTFKP